MRVVKDKQQLFDTMPMYSIATIKMHNRTLDWLLALKTLHLLEEWVRPRQGVTRRSAIDAKLFVLEQEFAFTESRFVRKTIVGSALHVDRKKNKEAPLTGIDRTESPRLHFSSACLPKRCLARTMTAGFDCFYASRKLETHQFRPACIEAIYLILPDCTNLSSIL